MIEINFYHCDMANQKQNSIIELGGVYFLSWCLQVVRVRIQKHKNCGRQNFENNKIITNNMSVVSNSQYFSRDVNGPEIFSIDQNYLKLKHFFSGEISGAPGRW